MCVAMSQRHPDDDRPGAGHGDEIPDLPPEWAGIVIPDDARELAAEAEQLRRERRDARRRARFERVFRTGSWRQHGVSGPLVALVLAVLAFFGSFVLLVPTQNTPTPKRGPLAKPTADPGHIGGLLPGLTLPEAGGGTLAVRDVRPALVALVPRGCGCRDTLTGLIDQTHDTRVRVLIVSGADSPSLPASAPAYRVKAVADPQWRIGNAYGAPMDGVTALFVRANGVVTRELRHAEPGPTVHDEIVAVSVS